MWCSQHALSASSVANAAHGLPRLPTAGSISCSAATALTVSFSISSLVNQGSTLGVVCSPGQSGRHCAQHAAGMRSCNRVMPVLEPCVHRQQKARASRQAGPSDASGSRAAGQHARTGLDSTQFGYPSPCKRTHLRDEGQDGLAGVAANDGHIHVAGVQALGLRGSGEGGRSIDACMR